MVYQHWVVYERFQENVLLILFDLSVIVDLHNDYVYRAGMHTYDRSIHVSIKHV